VSSFHVARRALADHLRQLARPAVNAYYSGPFLLSPRMGVAFRVRSWCVPVVDTGRVCVHRCVQDPQQVVTRNRGGYRPQPGGYPSVKGFVCPCAHHRPPVVAVPSSSAKSGVFPLHSPPSHPLPSTLCPPSLPPSLPAVSAGRGRGETIIPPRRHASRFSWLRSRRLFATAEQCPR